MTLDPAELAAIESDELAIQPATPEPPAPPPDPPKEEPPPAAEADASPVADAPPAAEDEGDDPETLLEKNPRLKRYLDSKAGEIGDKLAQKKARELLAQQDAQRQQSDLAARRDQAIQTRDPDAALDALEAQRAAERTAVGQATFERAKATFEALLEDPRTKPFVEGLALKDYGALARQQGVTEDQVGTVAALMCDLDLVEVTRNLPAKLPEWEQAVRADERAAARKDPALRQEIEKEIRPALEKAIRAQLQLEDPPVDRGSGRAPESQTEDDFARAYARGESNDTDRARTWLDSLDDTPALARR